MEWKRRQKRYRRLDRAERAAIQNGLERVVVQADGPQAGQVALDGGRQVAHQPHRGQGPGQGRGCRTCPTTPAPSCCRERAAATAAGTCATAAGGGAASTQQSGRRRSPTPSC